MPDLVYCPRCEAACIEDKDHCAQCPDCLYAFCSLCGDSWHPGNPCLDEEHVRHWGTGGWGGGVLACLLEFIDCHTPHHWQGNC